MPEIQNNRYSPIGVFDSGVGGLSVLGAIRSILPDVSLVYVGDQAHVPYGSRQRVEIQFYSEEITRYLLSKGARIIVVACNTASAAALKFLRQKFPEISFVGMEPAVKPAAEQTRSRVVGVLATPATFQGELYASVVERFAGGVTILQDTCPGLVGQIEEGELESFATANILRQALEPMLVRGIDTVVLGCTHYPFVIPLIRSIVGSGVRVIDPAPAVARQVQRIISAGLVSRSNEKKAGVVYYTSGSADKLFDLLPKLRVERGVIAELEWSDEKLIEK